MQDGLYAQFQTSKGTITVELMHKRTPGTVGNFVALAEGNLENGVKPQGTPYYDGLTFHRVIADFMIQGGCPMDRVVEVLDINLTMNSTRNCVTMRLVYFLWPMLAPEPMAVNSLLPMLLRLGWMTSTPSSEK